MTSPALSVLDLVPVRSDQTTGDALAATRRLARVADELGFTRYWLAEHHNMPAVAATNPPVLIAMVAAATERIRVGSGGVMLPNHAPLVVAEQFALLEAAYPGRIDLGIGRAPGTDPVTSYALRHGAGGVTDDAVEQFPAYVDNIVTMMSPGGAGLQVNGRMHPLNATPARHVAWPPSGCSAPPTTPPGSPRTKGLPYVFAHHFSGRGTAEALDLYRSRYRPSEDHPEPRTFLTVNAVVAPTAEEALRLAQPNLLIDGEPPHRRPARSAAVDRGRRGARRPRGSTARSPTRCSQRWVVGTPDEAVEQLAKLAATYDVDEVMLHPVAGAPVRDPGRPAPAASRRCVSSPTPWPERAQGVADADETVSPDSRCAR